MNNHDVLGVSRSASSREIKDAFRKAAKEVHPDVSSSPEAAEAFARIKAAHDALLKQAERPQESSSIRAAAARSAASAARAGGAAYATRDDSQRQHDIEEAQRLDEAALSDTKRSLFRRRKEPDEVRRHRKKLKTNERRLRGLY